VTLLEQRRVEPPPLDGEALFKEARERRRRRRLACLSAFAIVVGVVVGTVAWRQSPPKTVAPPPKRSPAPERARKPSGLAQGAIAPLRHAGPLAVGPNGSLCVFDDTSHEVLARLADGRFRVVAGDGNAGHSGDDGPATKAALDDITDMAFAPNGALYLAGGGRVRMIGLNGTIREVAGNGTSTEAVLNGEPARSASLGRSLSIAFSPTGQLYLATQSSLLRLMANDTLEALPASVDTGRQQRAMESFGPLAVDGQGNIYVADVSGYSGWSVYKVTPAGVATYIGYARRSGGSVSVVQRGPGDVVEAVNGDDIVRVEGHRLVRTVAISKVRGIRTFAFTDYFAVAPDGVLYADNLGPPVFGRVQQIVSVAHGRAHSLWQGRPERTG
jgi:hypothetical protein